MTTVLIISGSASGNTLFLFVFGIIWTVYLIMKLIRPTEFSESIRRPFIYYRMYPSHAVKHFQDFKWWGMVNMLLLGSITAALLFDVTDFAGFMRILMWLGVFALYNTLVGIWAGKFNKDLLQIHFIKWIYAHYGTYISSFILFIIIFLPYEGQWKKLFVAVLIAYFYVFYLLAVIRAERDLHIKPYYIILYLCLSEIIPLAAIIYHLSHSL